MNYLYISIYIFVSKCWDELFYVNCLWISHHCHEEMVRLVHTIFWIFHNLHFPFKWIWTFIHYFPSISCYLCIKSRWKDEVIGINCLLNFQKSKSNWEEARVIVVSIFCHKYANVINNCNGYNLAWLSSWYIYSVCETYCFDLKLSRFMQDVLYILTFFFNVLFKKLLFHK